jgi:hypothetical protein
MGFYPTGRGFESLPGYQVKSPSLRRAFYLVTREASFEPTGVRAPRSLTQQLAPSKLTAPTIHQNSALG